MNDNKDWDNIMAQGSDAIFITVVFIIGVGLVMWGFFSA